MAPIPTYAEALAQLDALRAQVAGLSRREAFAALAHCEIVRAGGLWRRRSVTRYDISQSYQTLEPNELAAEAVRRADALIAALDGAKGGARG